MPFQIYLIITVLNISLLILAVSTLSYAIYDTWRHRDTLEFLLRVLAISAGILIVGVSFFSDKSIPEIIVESIINSKGISILTFLIYIIPILLGGGAGILLINIFNEQSVRSMRAFLFIISMIISFFYGSLSIIEKNYNVISEESHKRNYSSIKKCEGKLISSCTILEKHEDIFIDNKVSRVPKGASTVYLFSYDILKVGINVAPSNIDKKPYSALSPNIIFLVSLILYLVVMFENPKVNGRVNENLN